MARARGVPVLLDGAQTISHRAVDVQALDCDFYAFSGHKLFGPTGIGVLWGREDLLAAMPPYQGGGNMIHEVTFEKTSYAPLPFKFEAGTTNIAGTLGLAAAIDYVERIGYDAIAIHEGTLLARVLDGLVTVPQVRLTGRPKERVSVLSLTIDGVHPDVTFNLSPRQLWEPELVSKILTHLRDHDIDPASVVVEITESAAMTDLGRTQPILWELHGHGLRLAIDDFGMGYSSLSRLMQLPVDILKIDRFFIRDLPTGDRRRASAPESWVGPTSPVAEQLPLTSPYQRCLTPSWKEMKIIKSLLIALQLMQL
jgi:hypothetical protein